VRADDGRERHFDGYGPLLGDGGSGYHIGRLALRAAMRAAWHPRRETVLAAGVLAAFEARHPSELISLNFRQMDGCVVAALAKQVDEAARAGDGVAKGILEEAADVLSETLRDAVDSMGLTRASMPLVGTGSVMKGSDCYWDRFRGRALSFAPGLQPVREPLPSAAGMALAVLQKLSLEEISVARANLFESIQPFLKKKDPLHDCKT